MAKPRRQFLRSAAAVTASLTVPCDPSAEARAAQKPASVAGRTAQPDGAPMPQLRLGPHSLSRLIVGGNPFHGYSHFNKLFSQHMTEWADTDQVCNVLRDCERHGVNTWQFSHHDRGMGDLARHRESGGNIQWILLSHREIEENHRLIKDVVKQKPIGIVHHGGSAERKRRRGEIGKIKDFLKAVRDSGTLVGLSTHDPEFLDQAEDENWDVDFYMTALYYLTRTTDEFRKILGTRPIGEIYLPEDPPRMFAAIRRTKKTCLVYKVLAAGRLTNTPRTIDKAFEETFENIKPNDGAIIGMYPKFSDQVADNAARVRRICASLKS